MAQELQAAPSQEVTQRQPLTPMEMLSKAMTDGMSVEILERLMTLNERWEAGQARKAFIEAKAAFKAEAPKITKDKENKQFSSSYTSIGNLVTTASEILAKHGLDARWDFEQTDKTVKVTCVLSHYAGHSESVALSAPPDTSGAKNPIQQIKSTITYLKIATFEGVTGLASNEANADDDGNASGQKPITAEQVEELLQLAEDTNADKTKICRWLKVGSFPEIPASQYQKAKNALLDRRKQTVEAV